MAITQTITTLPSAPVVGSDDFLQKVDPFFGSFSLLEQELNSFGNQVNEVKDEIDVKANEVEDNRNLTLEYKNSAETARDMALSATNFLGSWEDKAFDFDFGLGSCSYNGGIYISLQTPNINKNPKTESSYWTLLFKMENFKKATTNINAEKSDYISIDSSGGVFTITLPLLHSEHDTVTVNTGANVEANNVTLDGNSSNILCFNEIDTNLIFDKNGWEVKLKSNGTDWRVL